ncbi:hypothetical protein AVEN_186699-1 [Araneus ventricosus]|uniref:Uncharacterized protein n=1 Tax=Araneus ventricosus TaxID=182803 RepID=A0A4Y2VV45_ARAVE|nr:hypothetical protein AVEN_186699-1 [Araneus ventricosus]
MRVCHPYFRLGPVYTGLSVFPSPVPLCGFVTVFPLLGPVYAGMSLVFPSQSRICGIVTIASLLMRVVCLRASQSMLADVTVFRFSKSRICGNVSYIFHFSVALYAGYRISLLSSFGSNDWDLGWFSSFCRYAVALSGDQHRSAVGIGSWMGWDGLLNVQGPHWVDDQWRDGSGYRDRDRQ